MFTFYLNEQKYNPINIGQLSIDINLVTEAGACYYSYELQGNPMFDKQAYEFITSHSDGQKITLRLEESTDSGNYNILVGSFTNRDCTDYEDARQIQCEIKQESLYKKLVDNFDKTFNFLETPEFASASYENLQDYEYLVIPIATSTASPGATLPFYEDRVQASGFTSPYIFYTLYVKETKVTYSIGGNPTPPIGDRWQLVIDNTEGKNLATWSRKPPIFISPLLSQLAFGGSNAIYPATPAPPPVSGLQEDWLLMDTLFVAGVGGQPDLNISFWINQNLLLQGEQEFINGRTLQNVINHGLNKDVPELDLQSRFLNEDMNPVNGESPSTTKDIQLHSISDIKSPDADIKARVEETTLRTLLEDCVSGTYNCYWRPDERTKRLIIESRKDVFSLNTIDVSAAQLTRTYKYDNSNIPRSEEFPSSDSSVDFTGVPIEYDNEVAEGVTTYNTDAFYTEIDSILDDPDSYPKDGIVLICKDSLSSRQPLSERGKITGDYAPNMPMSTGTLHEKFFPYYRPFGSGLMNFKNTVFDVNRPIKVLDEFSYKPCNLYFFDPYSRFKGKGFNEGTLQNANYSLLTKTMTLNIKHNE